MLWLTACCMRQCPASLSISPRHFFCLLHSGCSLALPWTFPSPQKAQVLSVLHMGVMVVSLCLKAGAFGESIRRESAGRGREGQACGSADRIYLEATSNATLPHRRWHGRGHCHCLMLC